MVTEIKTNTMMIMAVVAACSAAASRSASAHDVASALPTSQFERETNRREKSAEVAALVAPPSSAEWLVASMPSLQLDFSVSYGAISLLQDDTEDAELAYDQGEINTGQDPTRPLTRLDFRYRYQEIPGGFDNHRVTVRVDKPISLNNGWALSLRFDAPFTYTDIPSRDNPNGDYEFGFTDSLAQALLITPPFGDGNRWAAGFGAQMLFPTGSQDQFGTGKWQLAPTVAVRAGLPEISRGSFAALLVRSQFSFAGQDSRRDIHDLVIQPVFNWQLPDLWFLTFAPEMRFDLENDGDAFIPFDILLGKMLNPRTVVSVQFSAPIVDDYPQYDWQLEFRVGFFF